MSPIISQLFNLKGRTALVTGAARGLGRVAAGALAQAGANVILVGRGREALGAAAKIISDEGGLADVECFDVTIPGQVEKSIASLIHRHGAFDILINNAGPRNRTGMLELPVDEFSTLVSAHLVSSYRLAKWVLPGMIEKRRGAIINLSSVAALAGSKGDAAYGAAKAGVAGLTRTMAAELGAYGITVNAIAPGPFATESNLAAFARPEVADRISKRTMLGRPGHPEEIAGPILLLASPAGSYITGQILVVDGGMTSLL